MLFQQFLCYGVTSTIIGGTARLRAEEGRRSRNERSERLGQHCEAQKVKDINHFILRCQKISNERGSLFEELRERVAEFDSKLDCDKLIVALTDACRSTKIYRIEDRPIVLLSIVLLGPSHSHTISTVCMYN